MTETIGSWVSIVVTVLISTAVNVAAVAYTFGIVSQRVTSLKETVDKYVPSAADVAVLRAEVKELRRLVEHTDD